MPKKSVKKVIKFRQSLFWDVDPRTINPKRHAKYIIERILDFGYTEEVKWLVHYYTPVLIRETLHRSRVIQAKSKSLWQLLFR